MPAEPQNPGERNPLRAMFDRPWRLIISGVLLSLVVGIVLDTLQFTPQSFFVWVYNSVLAIGRWVWNLGFGIVEPVVRYIIIGASVVVPIWLAVIAVRYMRHR